MTRPGPLAARLDGAGAAALALVPLAMALANRSSPALVAVAALCFLAGRLAEGAAGTVLRELVAALRAPLGLAVLALLAWALASFAWTPFPAVSLRALSEFAPTLLAAVLLVRLAPGRIPAFAGPLACASVVLAALVIAASLATDLRVQAWLGQRDAAFVFNRPAMTLVLLAGPVALMLWRRGRRPLAALALACALVGPLRSISGAAAMGLIAGLAMAALAAILPRRIAVGIAGLGLGLAVALAPVEGDLLERLMPEAAHARLVQSSSRARVAIARSFGAAVAAEPWRGAGFGVAPRFAETPVAARIEPELRPMLAVGHPHNTFLQVWAELGLPGAVLLALALFLSLRPVLGLPRAEAAAALGLAAAAAAIAFVEHNAWAAWWTASLGAAITWLRDARLREASRSVSRPA